MQAVILAGGLGTRLRPLTFTTPKPLLPILNKPMVERLIATLPENIDCVVLAVNYMFHRLNEHFKEHDVGKEVVLVKEKEPLGTGGAIKNVKKHLDDSFLVLNGDVICSLNIKAMMDFHNKKKGSGTISMWKVKDPTRYGIIGLDEESKITKFHEKPNPEEVFSNWINAGVYMLELSILDLIESNKTISIEREIFPPLADEGKLFGFKFHGYWVDAGTPQDYLLAHRILLDEKPYSASPDSGKDMRINPPVLIGDDCKTAENSELGPYVCLGKGVKVKEGTKISNSVLLENVHIGRNNNIEECIIGYSSRIEDDFGHAKGLIIQDKEVLKKGVDIQQSSKKDGI